MKKYNKNSIAGFLVHLHPPRISREAARFGYTFGLGGSVVFFFMLTIFSGFALLFFYEPSIENANASIHAIQSVYDFGWFFRSLHFWSGNLMLIFSTLHLLRVAVNGGYLQGRRFNWLIGIVLLIFIFLVDFSGYLIRWDNIYYDALLVAYGLVNQIPVAGSVISRILFGAEIGSQATLTRLYMFHIVLLPVIILAFMIFHFWRIRKDGGISQRKNRQTNSITRETLVEKEINFMWLLWIIALILSLLFIPNIGLSPDSKINLYRTQAPWIFSWIQLMLRFLPALWAGVIIPTILILVLAFLPYLDKHESGIGEAFSLKRSNFWGIILAVHVVIVILIFIEFIFY